MTTSAVFCGVAAGYERACPQRSEDSRAQAQRHVVLKHRAINFGGYCAAYASSVPVGNTGTTSTGQSE